MSQDAKLEHRLAAIMATDVVGYSRLIQTDEAGTLAALSDIRTAIEDQINQHRGRIANTAGDSVLAEFASAVEAVGCAIAVQKGLNERSETGGNLQVRIGIQESKDLQLRIGGGEREGATWKAIGDQGCRPRQRARS